MLAEENPPLTIESLLSGNIDLASPPDIFLKVSELIDNPTKNAKDVGVVLENDPGLATRLLKIVNSAFYGFPSQITSLSHAVTIVGVQDLRNLVLATLVVDRFSAHPNEIMSMREFWKTSVYNALLARILTNFHPKRRQLGSVFTCGLLHNIGRLVTYNRIPDLARAALLHVKSEGISEEEAERRIIGFDHYEVGAQLSTNWRLPQVIVDTLKFHGEPAKSPRYVLESAFVVISHHFASLMELTPETAEQVIEKYQNIWNITGLDKSILAATIEDAEIQFEEVFKLIFQS